MHHYMHLDNCGIMQSQVHKMMKVFHTLHAKAQTGPYAHVRAQLLLTLIS